jgi:prevent-host-death family protein
MKSINVTELRAHLPKYLANAQHGKEILVTSHGQVIARIVPPSDVRNQAMEQLKLLRKHAKVGDVISPIDAQWDAEK